MQRRFKYSGRINESCPYHGLLAGPDGELVAPEYVVTAWGKVPKYAPTIKSLNEGYNPSQDCEGNFMSYKFQPNNNCYAYGCNITTNSFPQPGRFSGGVPFDKEFTADSITNNAVKDGLIYVGKTIEDIKKHHNESNSIKGHYVALMFSEPESNIGGDKSANWFGDYHWARCDNKTTFDSWSQKDGGDQVTNFDFAGELISDPAKANWRVNQGPLTDKSEYIVTYDFHCYMFVPDEGVNII